MDLEADVTTLDAVLAFIDGYDGHKKAPGTQEEAPSVVLAKDADSVVKKRKRSEEKRLPEAPKRELERLRQEAERLEETVESLKKSMVHVFHGRDYERSMHLFRERRALVKVWSRIAARQCGLRRDAEEENERLKKRLVKQRKTLARFQSMIQRELTETKTPSPAQDQRLLPAWTMPSDGGDPRELMGMLAGLLVDIKTAYDGTSTWLRTFQSLRSAGESTNTRMVPLSPTQVVFEVLVMHVVPFDFQAVGDAMWSNVVKDLCSGFDLMREDTQVEGRETVFREQSFERGATIESSDKVRLQRYGSAQRFVGNNRMVLIHAGRSRSIHVKGHPLPGLTLTELHWNIFEPSETGVCLSSTSLQVVLQMEEDFSISKDTITTLYDFFTTKTLSDADIVTRYIEDKLLEKWH
ncbi:hypothetical protein Poli38472_007127 [Pythium oligandrum]|uniref:Uncharacterized protein n=1 Tax=Pythium oligandrum TaxID=41045 RepID=A0A8K1FGR6_PYTOL|nr:hypothetical protein Poli38472_007127 [Pythium oligandrum]|eukprot:TMW58982.1 hypothetical protein Poli38472_007127 [Pythium oligandrum]